jgi:pSer/pThr/pTyr-binding forkhead associated (FHA) protein
MTDEFRPTSVPEWAALEPGTAALRCVSAKQNGAEILLGEPRLVIGRMAPGWQRVDVDLAPFDGDPPGVSRLHAELLWIDGGLFVRDLGSAHGTFVDGEPLPKGGPDSSHLPSRLRLGSRVSFAKVHFEVAVAAGGR